LEFDLKSSAGLESWSKNAREEENCACLKVLCRIYEFVRRVLQNSSFQLDIDLKLKCVIISFAYSKRVPLSVKSPLNAKLNLICHLLALLGAHPILHVSRIRVKTFFQASV
jgi:hypothetical protein